MTNTTILCTAVVAQGANKAVPASVYESPALPVPPGKMLFASWRERWTAPAQWTKHAGNPVLRSARTGAWDDGSITTPCVLRTGTGFRMYYGSRPGGIGMATAPANSPHDWTRAGTPVLTAGPPDAFDGGGVISPRVVPVEGDHWHMYYVGYHPTLKQGGMPVHQIGLAESDDGGLTWRRTSSQPVIPHGEPGSYDAFSTSSASVLRVGDRWMLWYGGIAQVPYLVSIGLATSGDGHTWQKHAANPVFRYDPNLPGETTSVAKPHVILESGVFRMWYSAMGRDTSAKYRIYQAESMDGMSWERFPGNPVLGPSPSGWDHDMVEYAEVLRDADGYHMWYCGDGYGSIGYANGAPQRRVVQARGGMTPQPDASWRGWSQPLSAPCGSPISNQSDLYVQVRASVDRSFPGMTNPVIENICTWVR